MPDNYEEAFWEEIWGCVNYIKLPYETVMSMPVQNRKIWIQRHNLENEIAQKRMEEARENGNGKVGGVGINSYAGIEQQKGKE